jgi:hypothetical protein
VHNDRQTGQADDVFDARLLELRQRRNVRHIARPHRIQVGLPHLTVGHPKIRLAAQQRLNPSERAVGARLHRHPAATLRPLGNHVVLIRVHTRIDPHTRQFQRPRPGGREFLHRPGADHRCTRKANQIVVACLGHRPGRTGADAQCQRERH